MSKFFTNFATFLKIYEKNNGFEINDIWSKRFLCKMQDVVWTRTERK